MRAQELPGLIQHNPKTEVLISYATNCMDQDIFKYFNYGSTNNSNISYIWYVDSLANMCFTGHVSTVMNVSSVDVNVETLGGVVKIKKRGYLPIIGEVYINEECSINGIGLCILTDACDNNWYINGDNWIFNIHRGDKNVKLVFKRDHIGYGCLIDNDVIENLKELDENKEFTYSSNKLANNSNKVSDNEKLYTKGQLAKAKKVMEMWGALGYISEGWFKKLLRNGSISNIPFDVSDIDNAVSIYGRPIYQPKGVLKFNKIKIDNESIEFKNDTQILYSDVMVWCGKSYVATIADPLYLITVYNLPGNYNQEDIFSCWNISIKLLETYKVPIEKIVCDSDSKFLAIRDAWSLGVPVENIGANQHNSKIEVEIKILKERMRCIMARVGWKVPGALIDSLVIAAATIHNILPRVNELIGARQKLTGKYVDYNQMKYSWGQFGQGYVRSAQINNDNFRSVGVLVLYPKFNESGSYVGLSLNTKRFVIVSQFIPCPTPDSVIDFMNNWYYEELMEAKMKLSKSNERILENDMRSEKRSKKRVNSNKDKARKVIDNKLHNDNPAVGENECIDIPLNHQRISEEYITSEIDEPTHRDEIILGTGDNSPSDNNGEANWLIEESVEVAGNDFQSRGDTPEDEVPLIQNLIGNKWPNRVRNRTGRYVYNVMDLSNIREDNSKYELPNCNDNDNIQYENNTDYASENMSMYDNVDVRTVFDEKLIGYEDLHDEGYKFCFLSKIKSALKDGGNLVEEAIKKEFKQLIDKSVWEYVRLSDLTNDGNEYNISPRPINSLLNVDKKCDANGDFLKWKARFCACGNNQNRELYDAEDLSSPTMTLESVFIILAIAAQWNAVVVTADITGAYLESSLDPDDVVYMFLSKDAVDELMKIDTMISKYVMKDGRALVRLLKALYGTIQAAKLWYKKLREIILNYGFTQHPNDQCVFLYKLDDIVMIVGFHVDDLLMICKSMKMIDNFVEYLLKCFTNVTVHKGVQQTYLGMLITMEEDGVVSVSMEGYINNVIDEYNVSIDLGVKDPQQDNIFVIDENSPLLDEVRRRKYHKVVYMLVYVGKRVRFDIQMAVSFLAGRVLKATEEDEQKLFRVLRFLRNSIGEKIYYRKRDNDDDMDVRIWADSSWACHSDGTSRSAIIISVNGTCVSAYTHKQKLITLHATEAELVCLTDAARLGLWTRMFVEHIMQVTNDNNDTLVMTLMQDNESVIKIQAAGQRNKQRTRHLTIRLWWAQEQVEAGLAKIEWVGTKEMLADFLTKALHGVAFKSCWTKASGNLNAL